jgi:hypothetical protein
VPVKVYSRHPTKGPRERELRGHGRHLTGGIDVSDSIHLSEHTQRRIDDICAELDPMSRPIFASHLPLIQDPIEREQFLTYHRDELRAYVEAAAVLAAVGRFADEKGEAFKAVLIDMGMSGQFEHFLGLEDEKIRELAGYETMVDIREKAFGLNDEAFFDDKQQAIVEGQERAREELLPA